MKASLNRLTERAAEEGLLDVAYTTADSPFGQLLLAETPRGLVRLGLPNQNTDELLDELARQVSPRVLEAPTQFDQSRRQLELYFEGKLNSFNLSLDWSLSNGFQLKVQRAIARIPYGETRSYREIAAKAGNERAVRAAGTACGRNPLPLVVPCHRVLRTGGGLGGYGGGVQMKRGLLELEGIL